MSVHEIQMENYEAQVAELEALQSIYPKELSVVDFGILADVNNFLSGSVFRVANPLEYTVTVGNPKGNVELYVTLPSNYPREKPDVYARGCSLSRTVQAEFNKDLADVVASREPNEPCIYTIISWLEENVEKYASMIEPKPVVDSEKCVRNDLNFSRYWIYSHHIYSKWKRKEIIDLAKDYDITGFCLPGKPGIICMEGASEECEKCWLQIKAMNWQKILVKLKEDETEESNDLDRHRKFSNFQEISFKSSDRHNDMGELYKYLVQHDVSYVFKEYFGVEGKFAPEEYKS